MPFRLIKTPLKCPFDNPPTYGKINQIGYQGYFGNPGMIQYCQVGV